MLDKKPRPRPLFASPQSMVEDENAYFSTYPCVRSYLMEFPEKINVFKDFRSARWYLLFHSHVQGTYGNYRGIVERLLLWSWIYLEKSALELKRSEFTDFVSFCKSPPSVWVGDVPRARFIVRDEVPMFNPDWRPMDVRSSTKNHLYAGDFQTDGYMPFTGTLRQLLSICSSFYNFLHREGLAFANPVVAARPQNGRPERANHPVRNLISADSLNLILRHLESNALGSPDGERVLFIVTATLFLYLRPSDLAMTGEAFLTMDAFKLDDGKWWLVLDARNPPLKVPIGEDFLPYLVRYRVSRGLCPLPEFEENIPMLQTVHGRPGLRVRRITKIVKEALADVCRKLESEGQNPVDLDVLKSISLRWIRDSGAKLNAPTRTPKDLQKDLGSVSLPYVYGRYYTE